MNCGCVDLCGAIGQGCVPVFGALCGLDQGGHAAQGCVLAHGCDAQCDRAGQVDFTRRDHVACVDRNRQAFSGQKRAVCFGLTRNHLPVDGDPHPDHDDDLVVDLHVRDVHGVMLTCDQFRGARNLKRAEFLCR